jgi:ubiquinone/menaquinone biosynthesis C-methylase UbiE
LLYPASTVEEMASGGESELLDVAVGSGFTWLRRQDLHGENGWCFRA